MNRFFTRKGGVIPWRQSSDATTPPAETQTILRPHFKIVARGHALVARSYGTTATIPAGQTIRRPIFSILAKGRAIVWRSYGTTEVETTPPATGGDGDGSMSRKRYYLRRKGKILLFDTAAQADDYLEAEEEAQKAIAAAKSRGAKKRIAAKILKAVEPVESVEIAPLQELVKAYSMPVNLPKLLTQQDYQQVMDVRAMIQRIQDDEDDELLLLLA